MTNTGRDGAGRGTARLIAWAIAWALGPGTAPAWAADPNALAGEKSAVLAQATTVQAGTVERLKGSTLTLTPYAGGSSPFKIAANLPVYEGTGKVGTGALKAKQDVRIFARSAGAGQPAEAIAIEVLTPEQASAAKTNPNQQLAVVPKQAGLTPDEKQKQAMLSRADGFQNGKLAEVTADRLTLDPYQVAAGDARLQFAKEAPVYRGASQIAHEALRPGTDVRVFFDTQKGQPAKVVAIEVLEPAEAQELSAAERDVPRQNR